MTTEQQIKAIVDACLTYVAMKPLDDRTAFERAVWDALRPFPETGR